MIYVIIDDVRDLNCDVICRTGDLGLVVLERVIMVYGQSEVTLCIDHDLGDADTMNGHDVIKVAISRKVLPATVQIVSANPVGAANIGNVLQAAGFVPEANGKIFKRV